MNTNFTAWHELNTHDPAAAMAFYTQTLGWNFESVDETDSGTYWLAKADDCPVGGLFALNPSEHSTIEAHWLTYLTVENIEEAISTAIRQGGQTIRPTLTLSGIGKLALIADSTGAMLGLIERETKRWLDA